jgi:hypothetical protein
MKVSRREFVSTASCAAAASLCSLPSFAIAARDSGIRRGAGCAVFDLESNCALPESLAGMRAALGDAHRHVTEIGLSGAHSVVVVPATGAVRTETFKALADLLVRGSTVLWESGAAFLEHRDFAIQQMLTLEHFGISMERPIHAWPQSEFLRASVGARNRNVRNMRAIGHERVPYITYRWPREAHVRDFSRVIPVSSENGVAIAHWGEIPVAWRKSVGAGSLIFVGSPIGPALRAADSEAHSLFNSMISI